MLANGTNRFRNGFVRLAIFTSCACCMMAQENIIVIKVNASSGLQTMVINGFRVEDRPFKDYNIINGDIQLYLLDGEIPLIDVVRGVTMAETRNGVAVTDISVNTPPLNVAEVEAVSIAVMRKLGADEMQQQRISQWVARVKSGEVDARSSFGVNVGKIHVFIGIHNSFNRDKPWSLSWSINNREK